MTHDTDENEQQNERDAQNKQDERDTRSDQNERQRRTAALRGRSTYCRVRPRTPRWASG